MAATAVFPMLLEDGTSIDWKLAAYKAVVQVSGHSATAVNRLSDAPELQSLIEVGDAKWALELRCPKTLLARVELSSDSSVRVEWQPAEVDGELFLTPGVIAARDCVLEPTGLNALWGDESVHLPAGRWLARAQVVRTQSLASSLLKFHKRDSLQDGEMAVEPDVTTGDLRFNVWLAPNYFQQEIQSNRDVQIAALIGAFGRIPLLDPGGEDSYAILSYIRAALNEQDVPLWGPDLNSEYDPARAATAIERFHIKAVPEDET